MIFYCAELDEVRLLHIHLEDTRIHYQFIGGLYPEGQHVMEFEWFLIGFL